MADGGVDELCDRVDGRQASWLGAGIKKED